MLTSTIYNFQIDLADSDRGLYERLDLRVAQHPSETEEYLATRLLAFCLEYQEGIAFSKGLSDADEPAIAVRDLTGALLVWIDIGAPDAARLHKASKAVPRVVVYTHKDPSKLVGNWSRERIHRCEELELYSIDLALLANFVSRLNRRMTFSLSISGGHLYVGIGEESFDGAVARHRLP